MRRRPRRVLLLLAVAAALPVPVAAHLAPLPTLRHSDSLAAADLRLSGEDGALILTERSYRLALDPHTGHVTVATRDGTEYTGFPLAMSGGAPLPKGVHRVSRRSGGTLESRLLDAGGRVLQEATLQPSGDSFTVRFAALPQTLGPGAMRFFDDGAAGIELTETSGGFTPDPTLPQLTAHPAVGIAGRTPFAPPPFQIQLRTAPGWFGVGLVDVPAATTMRLAADGGIAVDYPLALALAGDDLGAGLPEGGLVRFPEFVVTLAADPLGGLRAYHDALSPRGESAAASPPGSRPGWWSQAMVDTWGEQVATRAARSSPLYTAGWVRDFVAEWKRRFGAGPITVVIDSRWQAQIGSAEPDPVRFGGVAGMRDLIDALHAQGDRVLLWWPMWARNIPRVPPATAVFRRTAPAEQVVDPTAAGFDEATAATMSTLLGSGPGELGADGVKLDWGYDIPLTLADPSLGWGATALYRYLAVLHADAHAVRPEALVDASAAAPQFASVTDAVRLYDAWSLADWNRRAAVVSAVDPDTLIDGDGWQATAADLVAHTVSSTVYGTPAMYFATRLADGRPIPPALAEELGAVVALSPDKGQGTARSLTGGDWEYVDGSTVRARSFAGGTGLLVWRNAGCGAAVSTGGGRVALPLGAARGLTVRDAAGKAVKATHLPTGLNLTMVAGQRYTLQRAGSSC
ncbi:MAG: hypothetical protein E6I76_14565 [Chloroflexi bacterium]|nr:MAG: hypothetical protein E6I76_14565 [Chloroflexota bacterium]